MKDIRTYDEQVRVFTVDFYQAGDLTFYKSLLRRKNKGFLVGFGRYQV